MSLFLSLRGAPRADFLGAWPWLAWKRPAAMALQAASAQLSRLAAILEAAAAAERGGVPSAQPEGLEFHAEAGALEGALYRDGQLVGLLPGVKRL